MTSHRPGPCIGIRREERAHVGFPGTCAAQLCRFAGVAMKHSQVLCQGPTVLSDLLACSSWRKSSFHRESLQVGGARVRGTSGDTQLPMLPKPPACPPT